MKIEEFLNGNVVKLNRKKSCMVEHYVYTIKKTEGSGVTLEDAYKCPSPAKRSAYAHCDALAHKVGILPTVVGAGVQTFSYGYMVYVPNEKLFQLIYHTAYSTYMIPLDSRVVLDMYYTVPAVHRAVDALLERMTKEEVDAEDEAEAELD